MVHRGYKQMAQLEILELMTIGSLLAHVRDQINLQVNVEYVEEFKINKTKIMEIVILRFQIPYKLFNPI